MTPTSNVLIDNKQGLKFTESPRWHDGKLWFIDIHDKGIKTVAPDGTLATVLTLPFLPNGLGRTPDGAWLFGDALGRQLYRWDGAQLAPLADLSQLTTFCLSDGITDAHGRFYAGDIGYNFFDPANQPVDSCVIVKVEPNGSTAVVANGLSFPNGMVITPDGKTLIVAECMAHRLTAFDIDATGALHNRRVWAAFDAGVHPDGICLDAEGAVWVANPEGRDQVLRVLEGGRVTHRVSVGTGAFAVMLGGADGRQLFICTSASHDPAQIARAPSARIETVQVAVAGAA
ncbi:SMP-30/gluconolactonase/LRE family protein [Duganella sp. FT3S]|uniref:SMP-30/gluconolactonase/LRE family protein n=1 Tax=Rugamonas fusca TaxID=2758568 RepID=A0A7W2EE38_9BURK|nr:SMP-30/gluconolactonase/LRE family protein [Rugamonas fusca]MBA5604252.1 SMP-30/gluconolactonase/LRE family protein [Rugamonas fusca]